MKNEQIVEINRGTPSENENNTNLRGDTRRRYTQITNATCEISTVRILRGLLAGQDGEMSAINTYVFQGLITNNPSSNIAQTLRNIAEDEMRHMELLGSAIVSFNGVPRYTNGQGNFWSARNVNYALNPSAFIADNIRAEEKAIRNYERAITRVRNESLITLLREIIEDERRHIELLRGLQ